MTRVERKPSNTTVCQSCPGRLCLHQAAFSRVVSLTRRSPLPLPPPATPAAPLNAFRRYFSGCSNWKFDFVRFSVVVLSLKIGMIHFPKYFPPQLKLKKTQAESDEVISCGKPITAIVGLRPIFVLRIALTRPGVLKCTAVVGGGGNWQESGSLDLSSTSCRLQ